jgi:DNA-binding GntR family transcriptional regulator
MSQAQTYAPARSTPLELNRLERSLLCDQVAELLRQRIISGLIPQGSPLIERELGEQFGVSRIPVRDALIQLEGEGLVVSKPIGRAVIQLTEHDVHGLYDVRIALETLAIRQAAQNKCNDTCQALARGLDSMRAAMGSHDAQAFQRTDMDMHRLIWAQSGNVHLVKALTMMIGPIFMLISRHASVYDWMETMRLHEDMVACVIAGDATAAEHNIARHLENARQRSLGLFQRGML